MSASSRLRNNFAQFFLLFVTITISSSCAVLTENQIKAVNQFAKATENFGPVPSNAIKAWAELQIEASAAEVASMQNEEAMWNHIETSFNTYQKILDRSERAIKSFEVLDLYSRLLLQLTSDHYTDALNAKSKDVGESLDSAIEYYNSRFGTSLSSFGGYAAGILRSSFGLYIRTKQAEVLRQVVEEADPAIDELTQAIIKTLSAVELGIDKEVDTLEHEIKAALKYAPTIKTDQLTRKIIPDFGSYMRYFELLQEGRSAGRIASSAKTAAEQYRETHHLLVENTRARTENVEELLSMVKRLKQEVDAGIKLKRSINN